MTRRQKQVGQAIRREMSDLLRRHVSDPRIQGIISVTEVDISADLMQAKVYISVLGTEEQKVEVFEGLDSASDYLRRELGARLRLRFVPRLIFLRDDSIERAERLLQLIDQTSRESAEG